MCVCAYVCVYVHMYVCMCIRYLLENKLVTTPICMPVRFTPNARAWMCTFSLVPHARSKALSIAKNFMPSLSPVKVPVLAPVLPSRPIEGSCCNYSEKTTAAKTKTDRVQRSHLLDSKLASSIALCRHIVLGRMHKQLVRPMWPNVLTLARSVGVS